MNKGSLLLFVKNLDMLFDQSRTEPQYTLNFDITKSSGTFSFAIPSNLQGK